MEKKVKFKIHEKGIKKRKWVRESKMVENVKRRIVSSPMEKRKKPKLETCLVLYLFRNAYLVGVKNSVGYAQPYTRGSRRFMYYIDRGIVPVELNRLMVLKFVNGMIGVDIVDYRGLDVAFPHCTKEIGELKGVVPVKRNVVLRIGVEGMEDGMKEGFMEDKVLMEMYPENSICLKPNKVVCELANLKYKVVGDVPWVEETKYRLLEKKRNGKEMLNRNHSIGNVQPKKRRKTTIPAERPPSANGKVKKIKSASYTNGSTMKMPMDGADHFFDAALKDSTDKSNVTKDEDWDFLTSLLEETPNTKLSLESELSPKKERVTKTHAPNFNPNGPYYTIPSASEQPPLPEKFNQSELSCVKWFKAAETLQRKMKETSKANFEHISNVQLLTADGKGRIDSIIHLAQTLGKTLWPTEAITLARARSRSNGSSRDATTPTQLRGNSLN